MRICAILYLIIHNFLRILKTPKIYIKFIQKHTDPTTTNNLGLFFNPALIH